MMGHLWGPAMFLVALLLIFSGYPVAFVLGGTALLFALVAAALGQFDLVLLLAMPERAFGTMSNYTLLAIPFFIYMGTTLEKSGLAERLLESIGAVFGRVRGGLGFGVIAVGALLAAATGVVGASVTAMGLISLPVMLRHGYRRELALGVIAAAATLGQIIPPSIVLIVLGDQLGVSVGGLFQEALVPGLVLAGGYSVWLLGVALVRPGDAPAMVASSRPEGGGELLRLLVGSLLPPLLLILIVLGSIFAGVATPTEAGALGAVGAMGLAAMHRRLTRAAVRETVDATARLTVMVVFLLIGSMAFALVFRGLNGDLWLEQVLTNLPGGPIGFLLVVNLMVFVLGFFIDFFEIAFIIVPLVAAPAALLGIDLTWLGVLLAMNMQTSFLTPPFGFSLFYLRGVTPPEIPTTAIYRGVIPFIVIQVLVVVGMIVWR
ncbi:MAG: TRAP transporter large permease subunit [Gemmatimonadales bacterium]|nr:TRAP transporter large permease subunit [Gemmatimonadales bacterium]